MTERVLSEIEIWENGEDGTDSADAIRARHEKKVLMGERGNEFEETQGKFQGSKDGK